MNQHNLRAPDFRWTGFKDVALNEPVVIPVIIFWVIWLVLSLSTMANFATVQGNQQATQDELERLDNAIVAQPESKREDFAQTVLFLNKEDLLGDSSLGGEAVSRLNDVVETGHPLDTNYPVQNWDHFWKFLLPIYTIVVVAISTLRVFIAYAFNTSDNRYFLADLPWRQLWPVPVLVLMSPWIIPFFPVSLFRLWRYRARLDKPVLSDSPTDAA